MAAATHFQTVQKIYIAFYQRPADPAGLKYWADRIDVAGGDASAVVAAFANSPEAVALYGTIDATTIGSVVDKIYMALFNKAPDAAGKQFYVDGFNAGTFTPGTIALNVLNGAMGDDAVAVNNKAQVANSFTQQVDGRALTDASFGTGTSFNATYQGDTDATAARDILKNVTSNPATVLNQSQVTQEIKTKIADATDPIMGQTGGQTFTLTTGIDNFAGTSGNDTFIGGNGAVNTYGPADQLDGGAGVDTVKLYGGALGANIPTLKNIENVYVNAVTGGANVSGIAGVESLEVENISAAQTFTMGAAQSLKLTNINATTFATAVAGSAAGGITLNNVVDTTVTPNVAQTLDVQTRAAALKLTATGAASNINLVNTLAGAATSLTTLNVEGDAGLRVNGAAAYTNLTTVDASKNTGGVNFVQGVDTNLTFTGGTGNDRVDVSIAAGAVSAQDKLDGGAGTDTLAITTGGLTAPAVANIKNFETLEVRGATVQDASVFEANNTLTGLAVVNTGGAQAMNVTNLAATAKDNIVVTTGIAAATTTLTTTVKGFVSGGTSDSATVTVNANAASTAAAESVLNLTFENVDVLNFVSSGRVATNANDITVTATDLEKLVVTGNIDTEVIASAGTNGITEVDASGLVVANGTAAGLTFAQLAGSTQSILLTGSNGLDTLTVVAAKGTVVSNGGNDVITFNAAAAALGDQSVNLSAKDFVAGGALTAAFTTVGNQVINFSSDIEGQLLIGGVNLGTTAANQAVGATINGQNNVAFTGGALQFDVNGDGAFTAADDLQITLAGVTTVTYNAANDYFVVA